jgi:LuxR family maltose regulon positive regulatory protein
VLFHSYVRAAALGRQAVELARQHGWTGDPAFGVACGALGTLLAGQGRPDEAEPWIQQAERTLTAEAQPAQFLAIHYDRGVLEQARGRDAAALVAFEAVEPLARRLASSHLIIPRARAQMVHSLVRLGQTERAAQILAELDGQDREHGEIRIAAATLRLAQGDPRAALTELAPILARPTPVNLGFWLVMAYVLDAAAREALGDQAAADSALEHALDLAEPDGALTPFLLVRSRACSTATPGTAPRTPPCSPGSAPCSPGPSRGRRLPARGHCPSRSAAARSACCATCRPT